MHLGFKCLPLALHTGVAFQLHLCLPPLESIFLVAGNEIGEKQGIGPLGAVFGQDAYEEQIDDFGLVELDATTRGGTVARGGISATPVRATAS